MALRWQSLSLKWKLVLGSALVEAIMLTALVFNNLQLMNTSLEQQAQLRLRELSVLLNASIAPSMAELNYGPIHGVFSESRRNDGIVYFALFDKAGKLVAGDGWPANRALPEPLPEFSGIRDAPRFDTEVPIQIGAQHYGRLQFGISTEFLHKARSSLLRDSALIAGAEIVLSILLLSLLGIWLTRHLSRLESASVAIGKGRFETRVDIESEDEIGRVAHAFNTMAHRIRSQLEELRARESRLQLAASVFTHAREGIMITDATGRILEVNDTFVQITGYRRDEVLGENAHILHSGRHGPEYYAELWRSLLEKGHWYGEIWNRRKNGEEYPEMITISAVRDAEGMATHYVALFTDVTEQKEHERALEHVAHYDPLTNLPNRMLLADRLHQALLQTLRRGGSLAVAFLDLDGFKEVNDAHGHNVGDALLIALSERMSSALRDEDTLARIGGDEFIAVLADLGQASDCEPVLQRLLRAAAEPVAVHGLRLQVSASIGVTLFPQDGADADQLIRHADQAMYQAKQAGKNRYHLFDVAHDAEIQTRRETLERVGQGLQAREFVLHFQPKVNMQSGAVIGVEALIRWQHPERGLLSPATFLPVVEDHPLSVEIGEWVIDSALGQLARWHASGLELPVSVNIGARQLQQEDFVDRLATLLAAHPELPRGRLELEILETSALNDTAIVSNVMHACQRLGVRFALDDFGTGYSSLTYLKRLPAEVLKIDQTFVRDMLEDKDDLAIVQGVIGLATAFRREVIAEGVETAEHCRLLLKLGCTLAQGYGIGRPMPAEEIPAWIASWTELHPGIAALHD